MYKIFILSFDLFNLNPYIICVIIFTCLLHHCFFLKNIHTAVSVWQIILFIVRERGNKSSW